MNGRPFRIGTGCGLAALTVLLPTAARPQAPRSVPAEWTTVPGWNVFVDRGCGTCHRVRGVGDGTIGPDLAGLRASRSLFDLGAAMWNHLPQMGAAIRDSGTQPPRLTPLEFSSLAAFLFTTQNDGTSGAQDQGGEAAPVGPGTPGRGEKLFVDRGCATCHPVGAGTSPTPAPRLATQAHRVSAGEFAGLMWNHGARMWTAMRQRGLTVPLLTGQEMADITAYLYSAYYFESAAGRAGRGRELVRQKGCLGCHTIYRKGGNGASDLAIDNVVSTPAGTESEVDLLSEPSDVDCEGRGLWLWQAWGSGVRAPSAPTNLLRFNDTGQARPSQDCLPRSRYRRTPRFEKRVSWLVMNSSSAA